MVQSKSTAGEAVYLEIKVDQKWETAQQNKQITFLRESKARGVLVLFSQRAALLPKSDVTRFSGGLFSKVSYAEIYRALDSITSSEDRPELREFAAAYGLALRQQEERTRKDDWGDPNS
jgi:shikimate kinase